MSYQLHIRLNSQLLTWIIEKAKSDNRTINNFVATVLMNLKQEEENATQEIKSLQSLIQPQD